MSMDNSLKLQKRFSTSTMTSNSPVFRDYRILDLNRNRTLFKKFDCIFECALDRVLIKKKKEKNEKYSEETIER